METNYIFFKERKEKKQREEKKKKGGRKFYYLGGYIVSESYLQGMCPHCGKAKTPGNSH